MEKIDPKFTKKIQDWLAGEHSSAESIREGAEILLALNRNKILYANINANPTRPIWKEKLEYELQKHLQIRLDGYTRQKVVQMDARVMKEAETVIKSVETAPASVADDSQATAEEKERSKGRRADHNELPEEIRNLFEGNYSRYQKIRALHTQLRSMSNSPACDRYEYLKQLDELDKTYRLNMEKYDGYKAGEDAGTQEGKKENEGEHVVDVNRTWVNRNTPKLEKLFAAKEKGENLLEAQKYEDLLQEFNIRIKQIVENGGGIGDKVRDKLIPLGVTIPDAEQVQQAPEASV